MGKGIFGVNTEVLKDGRQRKLLRNIARRESDSTGSIKYGYIYLKHDGEIGEWQYQEIVEGEETSKINAKCVFFESTKALMVILDAYDLLDSAIEDLEFLQEKEKDEERAKNRGFLRRLARILKLID